MKHDDIHTCMDFKLHFYIWTETDQNKIFPKTLVSIIMPKFT